MDPVAILVIGGLVFPARLAPVPLDRTAEYMAIATRVAGAGRLDCKAAAPRNAQGTCLPRYSVRRGKRINAWAYQGSIEFSSGAIGRLTSAQFAMLAGHEIAHFYLGHTHSSVTNELEADMLGALLTCRAGYRIEAAADLYQYARGGRSYPTPKVRRQVVMDLAQTADCGGASSKIVHY